MIARKAEDKMKINEDNLEVDHSPIEFKIATYCAGIGLCLLLAASLFTSFRGYVETDRRRLLGISDEKYTAVRSIRTLQNPALLEGKVMNSGIYSRPDFIVKFRDGTQKVYIHRGFDEYDVVRMEKDVFYLRGAYSDDKK